MMLSRSTNPLLAAKPPTVATLEQEMQRLPHLLSDQAHPTRRTRRSFRDVRKVQHASEVLGRLPDADEAVHLAISGRFALWHLVPAALSLTAEPIAELAIATLGFSRRNISDLCALLDARKVHHAKLLASHYFKGTSGEIYAFAEEELGKRKDRTGFLSVRTHAKLLLLRFADGCTLTVESSANLRSCKNIEQMTLIGDPGVHDFHRGWIDGLFAEAAKP